MSKKLIPNIEYLNTVIPYTAGAGISINGKVITNTKILTAGKGLSINSSNVISSLLTATTGLLLSSTNVLTNNGLISINGYKGEQTTINSTLYISTQTATTVIEQNLFTYFNGKSRKFRFRFQGEIAESVIGNRYNVRIQFLYKNGNTTNTILHANSTYFTQEGLAGNPHTFIYEYDTVRELAYVSNTTAVEISAVLMNTSAGGTITLKNAFFHIYSYL